MKEKRKDTQTGNSRLASLTLAWLCLLMIVVINANAQQPTVNTSASVKPTATTSSTVGITSAVAPTPSTNSTISSKSEDRYRLGPGDVLDIRFYNKPMLSRENVRVSDGGAIRVPMIDEDIPAQCLTESELAGEIAKHYLKYYKNPHIEVFIKTYASQPIAVIGAVNDPARFQLQRRIRLLQLIAYAKGLSDKAGRSIKVTHDSSAFSCDQRTPEASGGISSYRLKDILNGDEKANPYIQPGDVVFVPEAEQVFVIGNVNKPVAIQLKEEQLTFSRAIATAGGVMPTAKTDKIKLVRRVGDKGQEEKLIDYVAIQKNKAPDIVLQPDDIIEVGVSAWKKGIESILGGLGALPLRVIP